MNKFSWYALFFSLVTAFIISNSFGNIALADGHKAGKAIFEESCSSCHNGTKRSLSGKDEQYLYDKFIAIEKGNFSSGSKKRMKDIFVTLSNSEKKSLAKYISSK